VPGTFSFDVDASNLDNENIEILKNNMKETIESEGCPKTIEFKSCECEIMEFRTTSQRYMLRRLQRRLQSASLQVSYELEIEAICSSSDCSDAQTVANQLYEEVTGGLRDAIDDGSALSSLQGSSSVIATLLDGAIITSNFGEVVVPILALLAVWYPDWRGQSGTCKNDGNSPVYMNMLGTYYESSLVSCCQRFYQWDIYSCSGGGNVQSGFYPNWGQAEKKCLNITETADDMNVNIPSTWLADNMESCCEQHYIWAYNECISLTGGSPLLTATGKWYVNHEKMICQMDCPEGGSVPDPKCGGLANTWNTLYESAATCCEQKLSWIPPATCEAESGLTTLVGTSKWYVDWKLEKCVKDCAGSSEANCGGLAERWDITYGSVSECCERISHIPRRDCTVE